MKDEMSCKYIAEFVGLRSKMYSIRVHGHNIIKKAKGVKSYVVKKHISFADYMNCIRESCIITHNQKSIRSVKHNVYTISYDKVALNPHDDKRYIMDDNIHTLPYGHPSIPSISN